MKYLFVFLFSKKTRRNWNRKTWELYTNFGFVILFYRNIIRISLHFNQVTYVLPDVSKNKLVLGIADRKQYFWEISLLILIKLPSIFGHCAAMCLPYIALIIWGKFHNSWTSTFTCLHSSSVDGGRLNMLELVRYIIRRIRPLIS